MVKIISPASSGGGNLGAVIADIGKRMFGAPDTATLLANEKLYSMQRENTEIDNLMRRVAGAGAGASASDPLAQAMLIGGGYKPADFADLSLLDTAARFGATDPRTQAMQVGAGQSYDRTASAFGQTLAETARNNDLQSADRRYGVDQNIGQQRFEFESKPLPALGAGGSPVFVPQGQAATSGVSPILSETDQKGALLGQNWNGLDALSPQQQEVLGARVGGGSATPRNYRGPDGQNYITNDGITNAVDGTPLPRGGYIASVEGGAADTGLTNSTKSGLQQQDFANAKFAGLLGMARDLASKDPTNFGIPGFVKGLASDVTELARGTAVGLGYQDVNEAVAAVRRSAAQNGVNPTLLSGVFDPTKAGLETVADMLVYAAAEALAGQAGRSVSDKDVQFFKGIAGDPRAWLMSQEKYLAKLDQMGQILQLNAGTAREYLQQGVPADNPAVTQQAGPQPGLVEDGFEFMGGDPGDPANWRPVR